MSLGLSRKIEYSPFHLYNPISTTPLECFTHSCSSTLRHSCKHVVERKIQGTPTFTGGISVLYSWFSGACCNTCVLPQPLLSNIDEVSVQGRWRFRKGANKAHRQEEAIVFPVLRADSLLSLSHIHLVSFFFCSWR